MSTEFFFFNLYLYYLLDTKEKIPYNYSDREK